MEQRKEIKKLQSVLRLSKCFHNEIVGTLELFRELSVKYDRIIRKEEREFGEKLRLTNNAELENDMMIADV